MAMTPSCICIDARTWYYTFFMDDLRHTLPFAFIRVLSTAAIEWSSSTITLHSAANRYPIVDIFCLISEEIVFNRMSNVRLLGMDTNPQANASF